MNNLLKQIIEHELWMLKLSKREEKILKLRSEGRTLRSIGLEFKPPLTQERVRQIEEKAKERLSFKNKTIQGLNKKIIKYLKEKNERNHS